VQPPTALAERVLVALVRTGDETFQRDRDVTPEFAHVQPFLRYDRAEARISSVGVLR
jgi:hypothetical protein